MDFQFTSLACRVWNCGSATGHLNHHINEQNHIFLGETSIYLWDGQSLCLFGPLLRVRACVCVCRDARPVERLEADLGAEEVADGLQRAAGVRGQRGVRQQVWDQTVGLPHHCDVHHHAGPRKLDKRREERWGTGHSLSFLVSCNNNTVSITERGYVCLCTGECLL